MAHISQGPKRKVRDVMDQLPAKYLDGLESNDKAKPCCRGAKDHEIEFFKSNENAPAADVLVLTCRCGRKHYRMAAGAGRIP